VASTVRSATRLTLRQAILEGIREEMRHDPSVIVIGQDIRAFEGPLKCTEGLWEEFGDERVVETPICESATTSLAIGAGIAGMRPIVDIMFTDLLPVAAAPIIQYAANIRYLTNDGASAPLVIRTRGGDGPYRAHPQNYEALFAHSPGLTVVVPSNARDGKGLIKSAIRSDEPVLFIENIFLYNAFAQGVGDADELVPLGKAAITRSGSEVTVVTYGRGVRTTLTAVNAAGVDAEVVDLRTVAPLDETAVLESVERTSRLVVVHEAWQTGGIGAEVISRVVRSGVSLHGPPVLVGAPDVPIPWAEPLRDALLPTAERIAEALRTATGGSQ
jgi:pyruvate dehydrogenase E1 component beta subunit